MKTKTLIGVLLIGLSVINVTSAGKIKMPMHFKQDVNPEEVLETYPLGMITEEIAFSHHGKHDREILMPNGLKGWVYDLSYYIEPKEYLSSGVKKMIPEKKKSSSIEAYILVFGSNNTVIDVVFVHNKNVMTAIQRKFRYEY